MALIEIDGLPWFTKLKHGDFPWQTVSHNQMVTTVISLNYISYLYHKPIVSHGFHTRSRA